MDREVGLAAQHSLTHRDHEDPDTPEGGEGRLLVRVAVAPNLHELDRCTELRGQRIGHMTRLGAREKAATRGDTDGGHDIPPSSSS